MGVGFLHLILNAITGRDGCPRYSPSYHRKQAFLSATAGILFLVVAIFGRNWDWRGILALVAGVLWLAIAFRQLRKARTE